MSEPIGALRAELSAGHAQFASDMRKAKDAVTSNAKGMAKGMESAKKSFDGGTASLVSFRLKALASVAAVGLLAKTITQVADNYTLLDNKLKLVTKNSDELKAVQDGLYRQALESHSSYESSVDLYSRFAKATESLGTSKKDLLRITETLNKAMVISGATQEEAKNGIIQLSQGMASGVLRGEEFNSIMENGSRIARMLSDYLGVDIGQLRKMASEGKITSETMIKAFTAAAGKIDEEFGKMEPTISQTMTDLKTVFGRLVSDANKSAEGTKSVAEEIGKLAQTIDQNRSGIIELFTTVLSLASKVVKALGNIGQSIRGWAAWKRGDLDFFEFATMNAEDLGKWLEKNDSKVGALNLKLEKARLEWVKWNNLTKQFPSSDPNSEFNTAKTAAAKKYNDILKERNAILQKQVETLKGSPTVTGGTGGDSPKTTKAIKPVKSDIIGEYEQLEILAKDTLERVQGVWDENDEWMKTHVWDEMLGDYVELSDKITDETDKVVEEGKDKFADLKQSIEGWGRDAADALVDFAIDGKGSFSDFADSVIKDMMRMIVYQNMIKPLMDTASNGSFWSSAASAIGSFFGSGTSGTSVAVAKGGVFEGGSLTPFARGGIVNRPTIFPMASGMGLMGEAGPEAVMPLTRTAGGKLGVEASGGGNHVNINIINKNGSSVTAEQKETSQGMQIDVMIDQAVAKKLGQSGTASHRAMKNTFGAKESLVTR